MRVRRSAGNTGPACDRSPLAAQPSLWIHGAAMTGATWDQMRADLPHSAAPNLPGRSGEAPAPTRSIEAYATALEQDLGEGTVVIGHSLGGMVALELTKRHPARVSALVLIDAVATVRDSTLLRVLPFFLGPLLMALGPRRFLGLAGRRESAKVRAEMLRHAPALRSRSLRDDLAAAAAFDGRPHLAGLSCPTCVIVAEGNRSTHRGADLLAATIPHAVHRSLAGGHLLHVDNPAGLRSTIDEFLRAQCSDAAAHRCPSSGAVWR
jgi:pimeloyl-ACP methyl ester carboxylesterase